MLNSGVKNAVHVVSYASGNMETMGERIRRLREARGLTQEQFGKTVGVSKSAVSQWEGGSTKNIKLQTFLRVLEALHTDANYMIHGADRGATGASASGRYKILKTSRI